MKEPQHSEKFILNRWQALAALAWEGYTSQGRGAVIVDVGTRDAESDWTNGLVPFYYLADGSKLLNLWGGWPGQELTQIITEYNPKIEVVIIFLWSGSDFSYYRVSPSEGPLPPEARRPSTP